LNELSRVSKFQDELEQYGLDWDGPLPESDSDELIEVPSTESPLNRQQTQELTEAIDPLRNSDCYGIDIFIETLLLVTSSLELAT